MFIYRPAMRATSGFLLIVVSLSATAGPETLNGFDLSNLSVPRAYVAQGGPPRDGIPALTDPAFVAADKAGLDDLDRVLGVHRNGAARAYPLSIMNWHEVSNDRFGDEYVVVTYCPLCFTGMAFVAEHDDERQIFGVSGLLYNSDVLLYDHATESLWSQIMGEAVSGTRAGDRLQPVPLVNTSWEDWRSRHPDTVVLSEDTGHRRDYSRDPYALYDQSPDIIFDVRFRAEGYHPKEYVLGLDLGEVQRAWPVSELSKAADLPMTESIHGQEVTIHYDDERVSAEVRDADGELLPGVMAYWFAWYAFHPDTQIFTAASDQPPQSKP